ncbi:hypothetical protein, partial [Bacillus cereus]
MSSLLSYYLLLYKNRCLLLSRCTTMDS